MKAKWISFLLALLANASMMAEQDTVWVRTFGGAQGEEGRSIVSLSTGQMLVVGSSGSNPSALTDGYLVWLNDQMQCEQTRSYGAGGIDKLYDAVEHSDGHIYACGFSTSQLESDYAVWLVKLTLDGDQVWSKYYGGSDWDFGYSIVEHVGGGVVIAGETAGETHGGNDGVLMHISAEGELLSEVHVGHPWDDMLKEIVPSVNGGFYACGISDTLHSVVAHRGWLLRINDALEVQQEHLRFSESQDIRIEGMDVGIVNDQEFVYYTGSHSTPQLISATRCKLNSTFEYQWLIDAVDTGNLIWEDVVFTSNDTLAFVGRTDFAGGGGFDAFTHFWHNDQFIWGPTFGGSGFESFYSGTTDTEGNLYAVGQSTSLSQGLPQLLVVKWKRLVTAVYYTDYADESNCYAVGISEIEYDASEIEWVSERWMDLLGREVNRSMIGSGLLVRERLGKGGEVERTKVYMP